MITIHVHPDYNVQFISRVERFLNDLLSNHQPKKNQSRNGNYETSWSVNGLASGIYIYP